MRSLRFWRAGEGVSQAYLMRGAWIPAVHTTSSVTPTKVGVQTRILEARNWGPCLLWLPPVAYLNRPPFSSTSIL